MFLLALILRTLPLPALLRAELGLRDLAAVIFSGIADARSGALASRTDFERRLLSSMLTTAELIASGIIWHMARRALGLSARLRPLPPPRLEAHAPAMAELLDRFERLVRQISDLPRAAARLAHRFCLAPSLRVALTDLRGAATSFADSCAVSPAAIRGDHPFATPFATGPPAPPRIRKSSIRAWLILDQRGRGRLCSAAHAGVLSANRHSVAMGQVGHFGLRAMQ